MKRIMAPLFMALLLVAAVSAGCSDQEDSFKRQCGERHGHMYGSGLLLCLTDDGRIIEVYP